MVVRLHREANEVRHAGERAVEGAERLDDRRLAVHVERGAERRGQRGERDVLAMELAVTKGEVVHGAPLPASYWMATGPAGGLRDPSRVTAITR